MPYANLIEAASSARGYAYALYSKFPVGAALLIKSDCFRARAGK